MYIYLYTYMWNDKEHHYIIVMITCTNSPEFFLVAGLLSATQLDNTVTMEVYISNENLLNRMMF